MLDPVIDGAQATETGAPLDSAALTARFAQLLNDHPKKTLGENSPQIATGAPSTTKSVLALDAKLIAHQAEPPGVVRTV